MENDWNKKITKEETTQIEEIFGKGGNEKKNNSIICNFPTFLTSVSPLRGVLHDKTLNKSLV